MVEQQRRAGQVLFTHVHYNQQQQSVCQKQPRDHSSPLLNAYAYASQGRHAQSRSLKWYERKREAATQQGLQHGCTYS